MLYKLPILLAIGFPLPLSLFNGPLLIHPLPKVPRLRESYLSYFLFCVQMCRNISARVRAKSDRTYDALHVFTV